MRVCFLAASILLVSCLITMGVATAAAPPPPRCSGHVSQYPAFTGKPTFVKTVDNGKRFLGGTTNDTFHVVHLWGTPYEMGLAHGQLFQREFQQLQIDFYQYIESILDKALGKSLPQWIIDLIAELGAPAVLGLVHDWTKDFTPASFEEEMAGIAAGANLSVKFVRDYNLFPELIRAACTIVGANGPSTPSGTIQHLRALDFDANLPIKDFAQVTVYHGHNGAASVANFGWLGMIGVLTGFSSNQVGVGEKVWGSGTWYDGVHGQPWMYLLRDVLRSSATTESALTFLRNANRTCAIHVGIGDASTNTFRGVQMAKKIFEVFNDTSISYPEHPVLKGIVYWDRHAQPTKHWCLSDLLKASYGNVTAEQLALAVAPLARTGDTHAITFDYMKMEAFVANARKSSITEGDLPAYDRRFTRLDMAKLFAEPKP